MEDERDRPAQVTAATLLAPVCRFAGDKLYDDMCIVALRLM